MDRFEQFTQKANLKYNGRYDYSKFKYVNAKTASVIICPDHGEFVQKPDHHLRNNAIGCPQCVPLSKRKPTRTCALGADRLHPDEYIRRARAKHGSKFMYDMSKYIGLTLGIVTITCPIHGQSSYKPQAHLISTHGCRYCGNNSKSESKTKDYQDFLAMAEIAHPGKYTYPESNIWSYKNRESIVEVHCPVHGAFKKKAQKFISGQGCFKCTIQNLVQSGKLPGGFSEELFLSNPALKDIPAILYYLRIDGYLYKVGVTTISVKDRIRGIYCKSKGAIQHIEVIDTLETTLYEAYSLEQRILSDNADKRVYKRWSTELFNSDALSNTTLAIIRTTIQHIPTSTTPGIPMASP